MKKMLIKFMCAGLLMPFLGGCSADSVGTESSVLDIETLEPLETEITTKDLFGTWKLIAMNVDAEEVVDLNLDGVRSTNILNETNCFNSTSFTFDDKGGIGAVVSKLSIGDGIDCKEGFYELSYKIEENEVVVAVPFNEIEIPLRKPVLLESNGEKTYLSMSVEDFEVDLYVDGRENTFASDISRIVMKFEKE